MKYFLTRSTRNKRTDSSFNCKKTAPSSAKPPLCQRPGHVLDCSKPSQPLLTGRSKEITVLTQKQVQLALQDFCDSLSALHLFSLGDSPSQCRGSSNPQLNQPLSLQGYAWLYMDEQGVLAKASPLRTVGSQAKSKFKLNLWPPVPDVRFQHTGCVRTDDAVVCQQVL